MMGVLTTQVIPIRTRNLENHWIKGWLISILTLRPFGSWQIDVNAKGIHILLKFFMLSLSFPSVSLE